MVEYSEKYQEIGNEIIIELFPNLDKDKIVFLSSSEKKRKSNAIVQADCRTVSKYYKWCCPFDFMITVYEPNIEDMDDAQIRILLEHELLHCGYIDGKPITLVHDIEEFKQIIQKYGLNWSSNSECDFDFDFDFD